MALRIILWTVGTFVAIAVLVVCMILGFAEEDDRDGQEWDDQMNRDAAAGKLDFLVKEAKTEPKDPTPL